MGGFILAEATMFFSFFWLSAREIWKKRTLWFDPVYFALCLFCLCFQRLPRIRMFRESVFSSKKKHREPPCVKSKLQLRYTDCALRDSIHSCLAFLSFLFLFFSFLLFACLQEERKTGIQLVHCSISISPISIIPHRTQTDSLVWFGF